MSNLINSTQEAAVTLWYTKQNEFYQAECYFWCTETGDLPELAEEKDLNHKLLQILVRP